MILRKFQKKFCSIALYIFYYQRLDIFQVFQVFLRRPMCSPGGALVGCTYQLPMFSPDGAEVVSAIITDVQPRWGISGLYLLVADVQPRWGISGLNLLVTTVQPRWGTSRLHLLVTDVQPRWGKIAFNIKGIISIDKNIYDIAFCFCVSDYFT